MTWCGVELELARDWPPKLVPFLIVAAHVTCRCNDDDDVDRKRRTTNRNLRRDLVWTHDH